MTLTQDNWLRIRFFRFRFFVVRTGLWLAMLLLQVASAQAPSLLIAGWAVRKVGVAKATQVDAAVARR